MPGHRMDRIAEDMKRELSDILRQLKDPRVTGIVSVVRVEVSADLSRAKVYVSSIGGENPEVAKGLFSASGYIRTELSNRLHIRKTPELKFIPDDSIQTSARIAKILSEIERDDSK
jgi:ribosome-binding factor A